jgi:undecaprenyl diphosphate synthase
MRLSNFLLWQSAYSEYYYTPVYWPDFDEEEVRKALTTYSQRERRFGRLSPEGAPATNNGGKHTDPPQEG